MPKKKTNEPQREQSERFIRAVENMVRDGELNPIEADEQFKRLIKNVQLTKK